MNGAITRKLIPLFAMCGLAAILILPGLTNAVEVGELAPAFKLPSTTGKDISLSQYRGKSMVLIEFYHADFGPT